MRSPICLNANKAEEFSISELRALLPKIVGGMLNAVTYKVYFEHFIIIVRHVFSV